jgi:hypothetical protein
LESIYTPSGGRTKNPRLARTISIVPGLGQLYYGAPKRALQYLAGVLVPAALAVWLYEWSLFDLARMEISGLVKSFAFLASELVVLSLVITFISFWIAASWDARQGTIALNEGHEYHPKWWYVKVKEFLFDDPEEETP